MYSKIYQQDISISLHGNIFQHWLIAKAGMDITLLNSQLPTELIKTSKLY